MGLEPAMESRWVWSLLLVALVGVSGCLDGSSDQDGTQDDEATGTDAVSQDVAFQDMGMILAGNDALGNTETGCGNLDEDGVDTVEHVWSLPADVDGTPVRVQGMEVTLTIQDDTLADADLFVYGPDGDELGRSTDFNVQTGDTETVTLSGTLPPGDYTLTVKGCTGSGEYQVAATATLRG